MHKLYAYALIILVQLFFLAGCGGSGGSETVPPNTPLAPNSWSAGNPDGSCTSASIPPEGLAADTSAPTTVVGTGTTGSCTFAALNTAIKAGGVITFNCGTNPVTIPVTATINIQPDRNTVIDGGKLVTLDGGGAVQIMSFNGPSYQTNNYRLTLQHIALVNGKTTPTIQTTASKTGVLAPCSQGFNDGEGGALYISDGNLSVIDSIFTGNQAAQLGPDTGGAIYVLGSKNGVVIEGSTFSNNSASNAGAVGGLQTELKIYNSLFSNNTATGYGENYIDSTCPTNNGQTEAGSGGNGGAIYSDGVSKNVFLCGNKIVNNHAGADGGGLFFTSNNWVGALSIFDTIMTGNTYISYWWAQVGPGTYLKTAGTAVATNCGSLNVQNSTLQGVP